MIRFINHTDLISSPNITLNDDSQVCPGPPCELISQRNECTQPVIAQHKASPEQSAEDDGKQDCEQSLPGPHLSRHGTAQVARQQDGTENRSPRYQVENRAGQQHDPQRQNYGLGVSEFNGCLDDHLWLHQFHRAVHEEEQCRQGAYDSSQPEPRLRDGNRLSVRIGPGCDRFAAALGQIGG